MKSNTEIAADLFRELDHLCNFYALGGGEQRHRRLLEVLYLLECFGEGEDITAAKLAYDPDEPTHSKRIARRLIELSSRYKWGGVFLDGLPRNVMHTLVFECEGNEP